MSFTLSYLWMPWVCLGRGSGAPHPIRMSINDFDDDLFPLPVSPQQISLVCSDSQRNIQL